MKTERSLTPYAIDTLLQIPNTMVDLSALHDENKTSVWGLNGQLSSGYAVSFHRDSILKEKIGILNGKKQDQAIQWYPDGPYKQVTNYHKGRLHGAKKCGQLNPATF